MARLLGRALTAEKSCSTCKHFIRHFIKNEGLMSGRIEFIEICTGHCIHPTEGEPPNCVGKFDICATWEKRMGDKE